MSTSMTIESKTGLPLKTFLKEIEEDFDEDSSRLYEIFETLRQDTSERHFKAVKISGLSKPLTVAFDLFLTQFIKSEEAEQAAVRTLIKTHIGRPDRLPKQCSDSLILHFSEKTIEEKRKAVEILTNEINTIVAAQSIVYGELSEYKALSLDHSHPNYQVARDKLLALINRYPQIYNLAFDQLVQLNDTDKELTSLDKIIETNLFTIDEYLSKRFTALELLFEKVAKYHELLYSKRTKNQDEEWDIFESMELKADVSIVKIPKIDKRAKESSATMDRYSGTPNGASSPPQPTDLGVRLNSETKVTYNEKNVALFLSTSRELCSNVLDFEGLVERHLQLVAGLVPVLNKKSESYASLCTVAENYLKNYEKYSKLCEIYFDKLNEKRKECEKLQQLLNTCLKSMKKKVSDQKDSLLRLFKLIRQLMFELSTSFPTINEEFYELSSAPKIKYPSSASMTKVKNKNID